MIYLILAGALIWIGWHAMDWLRANLADPLIVAGPAILLILFVGLINFLKESISEPPENG